MTRRRLFSTRRTIKLLALAVAASGLMAGQASGQIFSWTNASGGAFNTAANWSSGGPPGSGEVALFDLTNTYTVTFSTSVNNSLAAIRNGNVTWALSGQVYTVTNTIGVGDVIGQTGRLTATNGTVSSSVVGTLSIGTIIGSTGFVTLGSDMQWNGNATIGTLGNGTLTLNSGASMFGSGASVIGSGAASNGTVNVNGGASWTPDSMTVGSSGIGRLNILGGGLVQTTNHFSTDVGTVAGGLGEVTVSGTGSRWVTDGGLQVGAGSVGRLTASSGGTVRSVDPFGVAVSSIGANAGSDGEVSITGTGTSWTAQTLNVGNNGQGLLTIASGGLVSSIDSRVGQGTNGTGIVNLSGNTSRWDTTASFTVGSSGVGTVNISAGADLITSSTGTSAIGANASGIGQVNLDGSGTKWTSNGIIAVGQAGDGQLNVSNQAVVSSLGGYVGQSAGGTGAVTMDGSGVAWNVGTAGLYLGGSNLAAGGSGSLAITNGAAVTVDGETKIWNTAGSSLTLNGGSLATNSFTRLGTFTFTNGTMTVNGGVFSNGSAATPLSLSSTTGTSTLKLTGGASSANVAALTVGNNGSGRLEVLSGADFTNTTVSLGSITGSQGTVIVDGTGSTWTNTSTANIGNFTTGTVSLTNGAAASAATLVLGTASTGAGTLNVTGSTWTTTGAATIGNAGVGTVNILSGGAGSSTSLTLGQSVGSSGSLTLTGGSWTGSAGAVIGSSGTGLVTVQGGGLGSSSTLTLGSVAGSNGTLNLQGGTWTASSTLGVGQSGTGIINISTGGVLNSGAATLGVLAGSSGNVVVHGAGASWNSGNITVGGVATGTLTVQNGGLVTGAALNITNNNAASSVTVDGAGSSIVLSNVVNVGLIGPGTLTLSNGSTLSATTAMLGQTATGIGTATLSGTGTTLTASNGVYLGGSTATTGGTGTLTVNTGTVVNAGPEFKIWNAGSTLNLNGGMINTAAFTRLGVFNFNNGTLNVNGGVYNHGAAATALTLNGSTAPDLVTLNLSGGASTSNIAALTVGNNRQGAMNLSAGAVMTSTTGTIGATTGGTGTVSLTGLNTTWNITTGNLLIGGSIGGTGTLSIGAGSHVNAGLNVLMSPLGTLNLNGGRLTTFGLGINTGSVINWTAGTLHFTNNASLSDSTLVALLGPTRTLTTGHTLSNDSGVTTTLNGNTTVDGGAIVGGNVTNNARLTLNQSEIDLGGTFSNNAGRTAIVDGAARLNASTGITNNGEIQLTTPSSQLAGGTLTNAGTLRGTGIVENPLQNNAAGRVDVTTGHRLVFTNASNTNAGLISMVGGEVQFNGPLTNAASTGMISGRDAILRTGGITNNGSLVFSNGTMDVFGDITQNVGGRITISGGGTANFYDDVTIAPGAASVQASAAGGTVSKVVFFGSYNGGVAGGGTAFIEGDHRPGNSPGLVTFGGDVFYGSLAKLFVELGGSNRGSQYDAIDVTGSVTVSGDLSLVLINSFVPTSGQSFLILDNDGSDPINGIFNGLPEGAAFTSGGNLFTISYAGGSGNDLTISAVPEPTTWALIGLSTAGAGYYWHRRRAQQKQLWEADAETTQSVH